MEKEERLSSAVFRIENLSCLVIEIRHEDSFSVRRIPFFGLEWDAGMLS